MHIVRISAGLGNQMFEYAFALVLNELYGDVKLDLGWFDRFEQHNGYELGRLFDVRLPLASEDECRAVGDLSFSRLARARRKFLWTRASHHRQAKSGYDPYYLRAPRDCYFDGYWQSYRYFEGREDLVRRALRFAPPPSAPNLRLLDEHKVRTIVGLHARRGDYVASRMLGRAFGPNYYQRALDAALEGAEDPVALFFSDDLPWCAQNIRVSCESVFVDWNRGENSFEDLRLMTSCDRLVICNSSFSWWGAWLGERPGRRIYAPERWFARGHSDNMDIIPPEWIRVGD